MRKPTILIACEFSGTVREAFHRRGWDAWSCDLLPTVAPGKHIHRDVIAVLERRASGKWPRHWDAMIAHPPCTFLANSGAKHLYNGMNKANGYNPQRWEDMRRGAAFFKKLWQQDIQHIAVENPVMLGYAQQIIGTGPSQVIQPWMFGHMEVKATCLWLKNLPPLLPTNDVREATMLLPYAERARIHWAPPGPDRWKIRSKTFEGIAEAMALQWGDYIKQAI